MKDRIENVINQLIIMKEFIDPDEKPISYGALGSAIDLIRDMENILDSHEKEGYKGYE